MDWKSRQGADGNFINVPKTLVPDLLEMAQGLWNYNTAVVQPAMGYDN